MSQTKNQRKKLAKIKDRAKKLQKQHNIQMNQPDKQYRLDVWYEGGWRIGVREWVHLRDAEAHRKDTEERRVKGEVIAAGRVVDLKTGKIVMIIDDTKPKGAAPDKIADGVKAAETV